MCDSLWKVVLAANWSNKQLNYFSFPTHKIPNYHEIKKVQTFSSNGIHKIYSTEMDDYYFTWFLNTSFHNRRCVMLIIICYARLRMRWIFSFPNSFCKNLYLLKCKKVEWVERLYLQLTQHRPYRDTLDLGIVHFKLTWNQVLT